MTDLTAFARAELLPVAVDAAYEAAEILLAHRGKALRIATKSTDTDPVSEADQDSERALVELLSARRPDDGLLGEEGADRPSSGLRWVVDPLDGTVNFLYGIPAWAVSVAVEQRDDDGWRAVAGAVLDPGSGELFTAVRGGGAHWGTRSNPRRARLVVNDPVELPRALVGTGFSYDREHRRRQAQVAGRVVVAARDVRRIGSAALDLCSVAAGRFDGYYEDSVNRWDWAAAGLVAREAGAHVTALPGGLPGQEGLVAAGPALHPQLEALVMPRS
jgi:myo-inositol-1(or 4)-monophosphatase